MSNKRDVTRLQTQYSGYDFGYLLKVLTSLPLPSNENDFFDLLRIWFPCIFDIKYVMKINRLLKGGLQDIADELQVIISMFHYISCSDSH